MLNENKITIGETATFSKTISESDIYAFAGITGDFNALHVDEVKAKKGPFSHRIAHGMLVGSLISTVLGTKLPGEGVIYLEQNIKFLAPVYIGDTCTAHVRVSDIINLDKGIYRLETWITNQNEKVVSDGYAVIKFCTNT